MPRVVRACGPGCRQGPLLPAGPAVSFLRDESSAEYSACNYTRDELMFAAQTFPVKALANGVPPKVAAERLGHADPKWTYWYLSAAPELLALAAERLAKATEGRS